MNRIHLSARAVLVAACFVLAGCTPYVNIPPQPGDHLASNSPNSANVRAVGVAALRAVLDDAPVEGAYQVVLPEGTDPITYAKVLPQLSEQAMWSSDMTPKDLPVLEVASVRIRGLVASVDVIRPRIDPFEDQTRQLVTVELTQYVGAGWTASRVIRWRAAPEDALRMSLETSLPPQPTATPTAP